MREQHKNVIVKANQLIDACFNLSLVEQRILLLAIVNAREIENLTSDTPIKVTVQSYAVQFNVSPKIAYTQIKDSIDHLFNRYFTYFNDQINDYTRSRWVHESTYMNEQGFIYVFMTPIVIKMISKLESHFTKYYLDQVASFKSKYSIRLYELVSKWIKLGQTQKYELSDLRNKLGILDNEYSSVAYFKRDVLDKAVKEINAKTELSISYNQFKAGRVVSHIQFKIKPKATDTNNGKRLDSCITLTPKQIDMFSDKLARSPKFQNHYLAEIGKDKEHYKEKIALKLADPFYVNAWVDYLVEVGYKKSIDSCS